MTHSFTEALNQGRKVEYALKNQRSWTNCFMFAIVFLVAVTLATVASADRISFSFASHHAGPCDCFNEINPGVFYTFEDRGMFDYTVGTAKNSYGGPGFYATAEYDFWEFENGEMSVFGGLVYYPGFGKFIPEILPDVAPIGGLQLRVGNVWAQAIPVGTADVDYVLTGGITFDF